MNQLVIVLYEPQDDINIGSVLRVCRNFGVAPPRLVRPASADPARIVISAPNAADSVSAIERFDDLDAALGDCFRVFGATARPRTAARLVATPTAAAQMALESGKRVAYLFGREDHGLPNEALDRCDVEVTIPTSPEYSSLNLAQAVLLLVWEMFRQTQEDSGAAVRSEHGLAPRAGVERMLQVAEASLTELGFFKYGDGEHVMRSLRSVLLRAELDERELAIWFGVFKEMVEAPRRASQGVSE